MIELLKRNFLAGIFVLIPFGVIGWIVVSAVGLVWRLRGFFPHDWVPVESTFLDLMFILATLFVLATGVSLLGWASKHYFGRKAIAFAGEVVGHIPVLRSVYGALDQLLKTISTDASTQFNRVVYVEYPRKGCWTLAFVTGPARSPGIPDHHLNIYVPTTPNPTSGFYLIVPESDVKDSHLKVEDAFKNILSLGLAQGAGSGQ
jgi:uncharacterized membrane protein